MESEGKVAMKKKWIAIGVISAAMILLVTVCLLMFGNNSAVRKERLLSFRRGSGGDMQGSSSGTWVRRYDDTRALITVSYAEWHFDDPHVTEYFTDVSVMDEIREVFLKYRMQNWDGKKFTNMFVADGASTSYDFDFETTDVSFSSQIYPEQYAKKLEEINSLVRKRIAEGERLPGLILPELSEKERMSARQPRDGRLSLHVYEYSRDQLNYRFSNGTDVLTEAAADYKLHRDGSDEVIAEAEAGSYTHTVYAHSTREETIKLEERLDPGTYILEAGGLSCSFEIGMTED